MRKFALLACAITLCFASVAEARPRIFNRGGSYGQTQVASVQVAPMQVAPMQVASVQVAPMQLAWIYTDGQTQWVYPEPQSREKVVTQSRLPFSNPLRDRRIADGDIPASGRWYTKSETAKVAEMWPKDVPMPDGLKFYWQTKLSQRIAITGNQPTNTWYPKDRDDVFTNAPTSFNPNRHDPRWAAPGGLVGVHGWESFTAASIPSEPRVWSQPVPIANGGIIPGGILWEYPVGTTFSDLLVSDGKPFELRYREKRSDGQWDGYVAWKDASARPAGYVGAGQKCATCHDLAGASEQYGITVRGKDTVFSYLPFDL